MPKRRTLLIFAIAAVLAFIALFVYKPTSREPSYGGHPLSYWVSIVGRSHSFEVDQYVKATNAVSQIGVTALPFLLKWLQYEPPKWRTRLGGWLFQTTLPSADRVSNWITEPKGWTLSLGSRESFRILGSRIQPASQDLCQLMNQTNLPYTASMAAAVLGALGTNALGPLLTVATNAQHPAHLAAIIAISKIPDLGDAALLVVPAATNCLNPLNSEIVQRTAIVSLGNLKSSPEILVPALVSCLKSTNVMVRGYSAMSLGQFGPQAVSAIPALTNALADSDLRVRNHAASALHQIDPITFTHDTSK